MVLTSPFRYVAVDTESALIRPGLVHPPTVCFSFAERIRGTLTTDLQGLDSGLKSFEVLLDDPNVILVFKNSPFDCGQAVVSNPFLMVKVFNAYAQGRIRDIGTRQELLDIYQGRVSEGGKTFVWDNGDWRPRKYTLAGLEKLYGVADREEEKADLSSWRYNFARLGHLPVSQWHQKAADYAKEDAGGTLLVYEYQIKAAESIKYLCPHAPDKTAIVDEINQSKAQWVLHLMSAEGIRTDEAAVLDLEARLIKVRNSSRKRLISVGILRPVKCTVDEVKEGRVDLYETVVKSRKAKKGEVPGKNQCIKEGRLFTENAVAMRYGQDKTRLGDLVTRYYKKLGKPVPLSDAGRVKTDKDTLYETHSRLLKLVADGGGVEKIINTYLPVLKQGIKYPINVRYNVLVNSGRTSAFGQEDKLSEHLTGVKEHSGCNIQNLPTGRRVSGTRECFIPGEGRYLCSVDYNTLELRALAQICFWLFGRSRMMEVLNSGKDLHLAMAADMLHISYHEAEHIKTGTPLTEHAYGVMREAILKTFKVDIAQGDAYKDRDKWCQKQLKRSRDCAKVANFGLPGGLGADSLVFYARNSYNVIITREEAVELIRAWRQSWPEMNQYFSFINGRVGHQKELAKIQHFWSGRIRGNMGYCDACNTLFQGLAADGAKLAMFRIMYEMYCVPSSPLYGSRMKAFIHDEFLAALLKEKAHEAGWRMTEIAIEEMKRVLPDVLVMAEPALMEKWLKDAQKVEDANGRLISWRPA